MSSTDPTRNIREQFHPTGRPFANSARDGQESLHRVTNSSAGPTLDMREPAQPVNKPSADPNTQKILETTSHEADNASQADPAAHAFSESSGDQSSLYSQVSSQKSEGEAPSQHSSSENTAGKAKPEEVFSTKPEPGIQGATEKHEASQTGTASSDAQASQGSHPQPTSEQRPEQVFTTKPEPNIQGATEKHEAQETGIIRQDAGSQQRSTETSQQPPSQETSGSQPQSFISQIATKVTDTVKGVITEAQNYTGQAAETVKSSISMATNEVMDKANSAVPESAKNAVGQARNAIPSSSELADRTKSSVPSTKEVIDRTKSAIPSANEVVDRTKRAIPSASEVVNKVKNAVPDVDTSNIDTSQSSLGEGVKSYLGGGGEGKSRKASENDKKDSSHEQASQDSGEKAHEHSGDHGAQRNEAESSLPVVAARTKEEGNKLILEVDVGKPFDSRHFNAGQAKDAGRVQSVSIIPDDNGKEATQQSPPEQSAETGRVEGQARGHPGSFSYETFDEFQNDAKSQEKESPERLEENIPGAFREDDSGGSGISGESFQEASEDYSSQKSSSQSPRSDDKNHDSEASQRKTEDTKPDESTNKRDVAEDTKATEQGGLARDPSHTFREQQKREVEAQLGLSHSRKDSLNQNL